jgi:hypothetical protein
VKKTPRLKRGSSEEDSREGQVKKTSRLQRRPSEENTKNPERVK